MDGNHQTGIAEGAAATFKPFRGVRRRVGSYERFEVAEGVYCGSGQGCCWWNGGAVLFGGYKYSPRPAGGGGDEGESVEGADWVAALTGGAEMERDPAGH